MAESQNGWVVPPPRTRVWTVPDTDVRLVLRDGAVGFVLVHLALWWHEKIEALTGGVRDDWGGAHRPIRGGVALSNHASYTAADFNATRHPLGVRGTFAAAWQYVKIRARLAGAYRRAIGWGGDYRYRADEMHVEIVGGVAQVERLAERLAGTPRGRRVLAANGLMFRDVVRA